MPTLGSCNGRAYVTSAGMIGLMIGFIETRSHGWHAFGAGGKFGIVVYCGQKIPDYLAPCTVIDSKYFGAVQYYRIVRYAVSLGLVLATEDDDLSNTGTGPSRSFLLHFVPNSGTSRFGCCSELV